MRVTIFQWDVKWLDVQYNLEKITQTCAALKDSTDLLVLPEMFNTGYTMQPDIVSTQDTELTINHLEALSSLNDITIIGSIPMFRGGKYYNTSLIVRPSKEISMYDKIHLFGMAGEGKQYTPGSRSTVFDVNEWKIQTQICYDLRFPYTTYNQPNKDVIIYCANWPVKRIHHWKQLLIARAIENQCYVLGVNRIGIDANGYEYNGCSMIIDYNGTVLAELGNQEEGKTVNLEKVIMAQFRESLPFLKDRIQ